MSVSRHFSAEQRSECNIMFRSLMDFEVLVTLVVVKNVLSYLKNFVTLIQAREMDVLLALDHLNTIRDTFKQVGFYDHRST